MFLSDSVCPLLVCSLGFKKTVSRKLISSHRLYVYTGTLVRIKVAGPFLCILKLLISPTTYLFMVYAGSVAQDQPAHPHDVRFRPSVHLGRLYTNTSVRS